MKRKTTLLLIPLLVVVGSLSTAQAYQNCAMKRKALQYQLQKAEHYGNYNRVIGLKRALANVNRYCQSDYRPSELNDNYVDYNDEYDYIDDKYSGYNSAKLRKKLLDKQEDIIEIQADIAEARAKGKLEKVAKKQRKLAEKKAEAAAIEALLKGR